jgi:nicotinamidase/pyrazinamidase
MKALIVVDVQKDFCKDGSLAVNNADEIVPVINKLSKSDNYDIVVFTLDWHPLNHMSFASNWKGKNLFDVVKLGDSNQVLWPNHCVSGTNGSQFHKDLITCMSNVKVAIFKKGISPNVDSYSGFYDNDHITSTGLKEYLKNEGVTKVDVCGLATDYCVKFTAIDAKGAGFDTTVLLEASRGVFLGGETDKEKTINELIEAGVQIS